MAGRQLTETPPLAVTWFLPKKKSQRDGFLPLPAIDRWFRTSPAEHDVVGEERNPLTGGGKIRGVTADQFVFAVLMPDQSGFAELLDDPAGAAFDGGRI
jgi:hypothetical protein